MPGGASTATRLRGSALSAVEQAAAAIARRAAVVPKPRASVRLASTTGALSGRAPTAASLTCWAGPALDRVAATIARRAARDLLVRTGLGHAVAGVGLTALPRRPGAAAGVSLVARAAINRIAATVARRAAPDVLTGARERNARPGVGGAALPRHAATAARFALGASCALNGIAAAVAGRPAPDALSCARERYARSAVRRPALTRNAPPAATLTRRAPAALNGIAATVARRAARDALSRARQRRADADVGSPALTRNATAAAHLPGRTGAALYDVAATIARRAAGKTLHTAG